MPSAIIVRARGIGRGIATSTSPTAGNVPSTSGINVIEVNLASSNQDWVLDTGSCAHICSNINAL